MIFYDRFKIAIHFPFGTTMDSLWWVEFLWKRVIRYKSFEILCKDLCFLLFFIEYFLFVLLPNFKIVYILLYLFLFYFTVSVDDHSLHQLLFPTFLILVQILKLDCLISSCSWLILQALFLVGFACRKRFKSLGFDELFLRSVQLKFQRLWTTPSFSRTTFFRLTFDLQIGPFRFL